MEKGLNTDINVSGTQYHVQTEDWGPKHRVVVSQIYRGGAVLKTIKTPYQGPKSDAQSIRLVLREQHNEILDLLISGQL